MPDLSLKLFNDTAYIGQQQEVLFTQPVLWCSFRHLAEHCREIAFDLLRGR